MSSFFTTPASQKKRKRTDPSQAPSQKRRNVTSANKSGARPPPASKRRQARDESISGSDSDDEGPRGPQDDASIEGSEESEYENETAAERRLRLAEQYLENVREEVDEVGFDAAEIDRDLIAERLKEDVAETKGKLHKHIADTLDWGRAKTAKMAWGGSACTGIARSKSTDGEHDYLYAVSKDNVVVKWEVPKPFIKAASTRTKFDGEGQASTTSSIDQTPSTNGINGQSQSSKRSRTPRRLAHFSCRRPPSSTPFAPGVTLHTGKILCIAAAPSGKYLATGSSDKRIVIWSVGSSPSELVPIKTFTQHRDAVLGLSFRIALGGGSVTTTASRGNISGGANQMFSASADRTIKLWDLDAMTYVETLFGHQDTVVDVAACAGEKCVSVGARDRTARFWKVVEENQLVFRGGGVHKARGENVPGAAFSLASKLNDGDEHRPEVKGYAEGSIDRVALVDEETFVTGSDNGSICLWNIHKKKPIFTIPLAHGLDPLLTREEALAEDPALTKAGRGAAENWEPPPQEPRYITGLATVPYSDVVISASWDGCIRAWKVSEDKRRIDGMGVIGTVDERSLDPDGIGDAMIGEKTNGHQQGVNLKEQKLVRGIANDVTAFERGERGKDGLYIAMAVGKEHRLGRWKKTDGSNGVVIFEVPFKEKSEDVVANGSSKPQG
ncbi:WD40 repeat-like protein [Viridothelium virens]|uniref:WD40 repeat-like protein n=1 Tax=Viridothelium virens TaxID=1048519 RepID=A0A6A6HMW1_VIRVR|nr:WD40 repeat-like protein [Viridothelium virens]